MATISQGARAQFATIVESSWGVEPVSPQTQVVPFMNFNLNLTKDTFEDNSIRSDAMAHHLLQGNHHVQGDVDVNFSHGVYMPFMESLMFSSASAGVLKAGTTAKSFTAELGHLDVNQYRVFNGLMVDKFQITIPSSGFVTAKFSFIGKKMTLNSTSIDSTPTVAANKKPMIHNGGTFKEGGTTVGYMQSVTFTIDNGLAANPALGSDFARGITRSMQKITGNVSVYFEDAVMANKFINGTASSLEFQLTDGTNTCDFLLPVVYYTGANITVSGSGPVALAMPFVAISDDVTNFSNFVFTESV